MVDFAVKAWDEKGPIGSGTHTRAIISNEKFLGIPFFMRLYLSFYPICSQCHH